jgi:hypothetical protein
MIPYQTRTGFNSTTKKSMRSTKGKPFNIKNQNQKYENIINTNYFASTSPKKNIDMKGLNFIAGLPDNMG